MFMYLCIYQQVIYEMQVHNEFCQKKKMKIKTNFRRGISSLYDFTLNKSMYRMDMARVLQIIISFNDYKL